MLRMSCCFLLAVLASVTTPALALDVYECKFPIVANNMGYLPDVVVMARETGADRVTLVDAYIQSEKGGPIEVKIAAESDAKLSVSWPLMLKSRANEYVKMQYRMSIQKSGLTASLSGRPQGFSNNFTAQGTCKRLKG
jgi:hypothetical protein